MLFCCASWRLLMFRLDHFLKYSFKKGTRPILICFRPIFFFICLLCSCKWFYGFEYLNIMQFGLRSFWEKDFDVKDQQFFFKVRTVLRNRWLNTWYLHSLKNHAIGKILHFGPNGILVYLGELLICLSKLVSLGQISGGAKMDLEGHGAPQFKYVPPTSTSWPGSYSLSKTYWVIQELLEG